jgi:hypothetical protein
MKKQAHSEEGKESPKALWCGLTTDFDWLASESNTHTHVLANKGAPEAPWEAIAILRRRPSP